MTTPTEAEVREAVEFCYLEAIRQHNEGYMGTAHRIKVLLDALRSAKADTAIVDWLLTTESHKAGRIRALISSESGITRQIISAAMSSDKKGAGKV